jgi:AraC-like DNA-binding protein
MDAKVLHMPRLLWIGKVTDPLFKSLPHSHDNWELCIYTSGEGIALIGDQQVQFRPGTIICYPPVIPHQEHSPGGCLEYFIHADGFATTEPGIPVYADSPDAAFSRVATQLWYEYQMRERGWEQVTQQLFQVLLAYIDRWCGGKHYPLVAQLKHLIMQGFTNPDFSLPEAMESLPMSTDHLRRLFVRATGTTPSAFLTSLRIEEAKRLLQLMRLGVKETSWQVGYRHQAYFSRVFRKQTGMWPSEFADASSSAGA